MEIVGYFSSIKDADTAVDELKKAGLSKAYTDINDHYTLNNNPENSIAGTESAPSLSSLVLNAGKPINYQDKAPLAAASPMVSGMGDFEEVTDYNYKVIVETDSGSYENAAGIIKNMGGSIKNPNLDIHKRIKDVSLDKADINDIKS